MTKQFAVAITGLFSTIVLSAASKAVELKNATGQSVGTATISE